MELELLERKIRRLVCKLKKHDINVEVFDHTDIEYGPLLGKGGEGEVYKCTVVYNDVPVEAAAKTLLDNSDDAISFTLEEIELLCLARDPIINTTLQVYGVSAVPDDDDPEVGHLVIITEAGLMNALQLYQQEDIPLAVTLGLWKRLAAALHTIHIRRIMHHDLKPENILVTAINRDRNGQIEKIDFKVIDLGMGKRVFTDKVVTDDILGTKGYHAPEVLFEDSYDFRADIFMLGITFCVLLHSPSFLRSKTRLRSFLKDVHNAKEKKLTGRKLYDKVVVPTFDDDQNIPAVIVNMICSMLEKQNKRNISLLDIVYTCDEEAGTLDSRNKNSRQALLPLPSKNCQDSGILSSETDDAQTKRVRKRASTNRQTRVSRSSSPSSSQRCGNRNKAGVRSAELAWLLDGGRDDDVFYSRRTRQQKPCNSTSEREQRTTERQPTSRELRRGKAKSVSQEKLQVSRESSRRNELSAKSVSSGDSSREKRNLRRTRSEMVLPSPGVERRAMRNKRGRVESSSVSPDVIQLRKRQKKTSYKHFFTDSG